MKALILVISAVLFAACSSPQQLSEWDCQQCRFNDMAKPATVTASYEDPYYHTCIIQVRAADGAYHAFRGQMYCFGNDTIIK